MTAFSLDLDAMVLGQLQSALQRDKYLSWYCNTLFVADDYHGGKSAVTLQVMLTATVTTYGS